MISFSLLRTLGFHFLTLVAGLPAFASSLDPYRAEISTLIEIAESQAKTCSEFFANLRSDIPTSERETGAYSEVTVRKALFRIKSFEGLNPELSRGLESLLKKVPPKKLEEQDAESIDRLERNLLVCFPASVPNFARRLTESASRIGKPELKTLVLQETRELLEKTKDYPFPFMVAIFQLHAAEELATLGKNPEEDLRRIERYGKQARKWRSTVTKNASKAWSAEDYSKYIKVKLDSFRSGALLRKELLGEMRAISEPIAFKESATPSQAPLPQPSASPSPAAMP